MFEFDFALSDYNQALEIDPKDGSVKVRLSVVFNELGLLSYADKRYVQAFEYFDLAIQYNPKVAVYYTSRARARYMLEVRKILTNCQFLSIVKTRHDPLHVLMLDCAGARTPPLLGFCRQERKRGLIH